MEEASESETWSRGESEEEEEVCRSGRQSANKKGEEERREGLGVIGRRCRRVT